MRFATPLVPATLIRRYKRFLADAALDDGQEVTAHCASPGSMLGLMDPGTRIWLEPNDDPKRKLNWGWRLVEHPDGHFTGVDTALPNRMLKTALAEGRVPGLTGYERLQAEVPCGTGSRLDFLLTGAGRRDAWVEVKSVTLSRRPGLAEFPDTVTARGAKHIAALRTRAGAGDRAVLLYLVQRTDAERVAVAADLDPAYAAALAAAPEVEVLALGCRITPEGIWPGDPLPFDRP